jgi:hypothetical protein
VRRGVPAAATALAASAAVLLAFGAGGATGDTTAPLAPAPAPSATLAQLRQEVGGRGAAATPERYAYLAKIDGPLQDVAASRLGAGSAAAAAIAARRQGVTVSAQGGALADVYVRGDAAAAADDLRALGMRVTAVGERAPQRMVEGYLPPGSIAAAAALDSTKAIVTPFARRRSGNFLSQGDAAINGPEARALGPSGAGVSVGIISDSINQVAPGIAGSVSSGDLPPDTVAFSDQPGGTDEGRAMAEILYDEAPGVDRIRFETASGGPLAKANAIDTLVADGAKVIADDTSYLAEPFFQDDVIAQAVDRAKAAGVAYFVSAGNDARHGWAATYSPVGDPSGQSSSTENFDPGGVVDTRQTIGSFAANDTVTLVLQWAEPWGRAASDFAIDVYDAGGATPIRTIDTNNVVTGLPVEAQPLTFASAATIEVAIRRVSGSGNPFLKLVAFTNGAGNVVFDHPADGSAIDPGASSASGALTVAASDWSTPETPEAFSSRGPVTHFFDLSGNPLAAPEVRQKPDLVGPDNVLTSVPGFDQFQGTSAAAPAAAGIAALIRSAKPAMAIDELYAIMTDPANALDCPAPGNPDSDCGVGFVLADSALAMALDPTPPLVAASVSPAAPDGANGWYRVPVSVSWQISDRESPVVDPSGCDPVSLTGSASLTCSATSAGGTTAAPLTVKIDPTPPSSPVLTGIAARTYVPSTLPSARAIACNAGDPTSGVASCSIAGYASGFGAHELVATATNGAGLTATSTLRYTVAKPLAISLLKLPAIRLRKLRASGLALRVRVAAPSTRIVVRLVALVPAATGSSTRALAVGGLSKSFPAGAVTLHVKLTAAGKRQLRALARTTLRIAISASSPRAKSASLKRSLVVRR